jgi:hypothetical protein
MHTKRNLTAFIMIILLSLTSLLVACGAAPQMASREALPEAPEGEGAFGAPAVQPDIDQRTLFQSDDSAQTAERIVIKNGNLDIVVADPAASMERISRLAEELGGFVVSANLYQQQLDGGVEVPRAAITIRVLAEHMDDAMNRIRQESDRLPLSETVNSQDVTSEYTDLQSRLTNLEKTEEQLQQIMDEATRTEDVLSVYNQLVSVREQIEVIKGQIKYYEQSAALSAISVNLIANEAVQPLTVGNWEVGGVAKQAIQALIDAVQTIVYAATWTLLYILPVLLLIGLIFVLPVYLVIRFIRRRRKSRPQHPAPVEPASPTV